MCRLKKPFQTAHEQSTPPAKAQSGRLNGNAPNLNANCYNSRLKKHIKAA